MSIVALSVAFFKQIAVYYLLGFFFVFVLCTLVF